MLHKLVNDRLRSYIASYAQHGLTPKEIGERLGITAESVRKRARNAGIKLTPDKRGAPKKDSARDALIALRYGAGEPIKIIAADFGISEGVVAGIISRAGVPKRFGSVTPSEIARIRKLHRAGHSAYSIGKKIGRSTNAVRRAITLHA